MCKQKSPGTIKLLGLYVVIALGFEPRTACLEGRCSIQLSYATFFTVSRSCLSAGVQRRGKLCDLFSGCKYTFFKKIAFLRNKKCEKMNQPVPNAYNPLKYRVARSIIFGESHKVANRVGIAIRAKNVSIRLIIALSDVVAPIKILAI